LKIHKWYNFDETTWNLLVNWIREYQSRNEALLTYEGHVELPSDWEYYYFGSRSFSKKTGKFLIANLLGEVLKEFNFYSKGGDNPAIPTFMGSLATDFIKISGVSYSSYTFEVYVPFFNWLEIFLKSKPQKIRVEFWLEFFDEYAAEMLLHIMKAIEIYNSNNSIKVQQFWYVREEDLDIIESGESFTEEISSLEIVILDWAQWERMNK
jgi:hypothetical protein